MFLPCYNGELHINFSQLTVGTIVAFKRKQATRKTCSGIDCHCPVVICTLATQKENNMKFTTHTLAIYTMCLFGTVSLIGGCASTGMQRSAKASTSIRDVDSELRKFVVQCDTTAASLDSLIKPEQGDLKKSFNKYSDQLAKLDHEGKRVVKRLDEMKSHSSEYFSEWEKQGDAFTNPEIRELSEDRRAKLAEIYDRVPKAGAGVKGAYTSYLTNLREIQKFLSNDLTPKGIESITPVASKAVQDLDTLKTSIQPIITALDEINAELYSKKK